MSRTAFIVTALWARRAPSAKYSHATAARARPARGAKEATAA